VYFIKFLDSMDAYPEQRAMAAFVLAVIVDGHRRGQEACAKESLIHVCLRHLQLASPHEAQTEPLLLQWLCLCLGKLWEDYPAAQLIGLQLDAPAICAPLLSVPQPEVRPIPPPHNIATNLPFQIICCVLIWIIFVASG